MQQNKNKEELQKEFTEKALRNKVKDELHYKLTYHHLSRVAKSSIQHYIETGKISGTFWIGLAEYAEDFADQQNQELRVQIEQIQAEAELDDKIIQNLKAEVKRLKEGLEEIKEKSKDKDSYLMARRTLNQLLKTNGDE